MAPFRFRLQTVLRLREHEERSSAQGVARARQGADEARRARSDLEAVREAGRARVIQAHGSGAPVGHLQNMALVGGSGDARIRDADQECVHADQRVVESVKVYQQALTQRRCMDKLRARRLEEWRSEQNRTEQQVMDEIALTRHGRGGVAPEPEA
ncbi:MAG: flagellar export protein FliJ [Gemmatimonadetes bacterium]|nr:flagellar export protein FliJ [Gemmatimonadota bacterium]